MLFIAVGAFIFANLIVAVVVTNLECAVLEVRKEEQEQARGHGSAKEDDAGEVQGKERVQRIPIISDEGISTNTFKKQKPLFVPVWSYF